MHVVPLTGELNRRYKNASAVNTLLAPDMRTLREMHRKVHDLPDTQE